MFYFYTIYDNIADEDFFNAQKEVLYQWHLDDPVINSGIIRTNRTWYKGPIKCRDYSSTIDITPSWPFNWVGSSPIRKVNFGTACIMPDGRVEIQK